MHLTVEQALSIFPLSEGKLIAGRSGTSRIVKSVNVMDAPDITDWIKDGEMLFTTAYLMKDRPADAVQLLRKLDQRGSAGLGIKLGRFWTEVPEAILEEADRLAFPLIELPFQFTFSDQMNGLFQAEMQRNTRVLHSVLDKQKKLMRFALKSDHISDFFHTIMGIIGYSIAVVNYRGHVLFNATPLAEARLTRGWPWKDAGKWIYTEDGRCFRVPLTEKDECVGYAMFYTMEDQLMKVEEGLFLQAAEIISYHISFIYKEYTENTIQNDLGTLMSRYLKGDGTLKTLMDGAERLGIPLLRGPYQCVLTAVGPLKGEGGRERLLRSIREELQCHPELKGLQVLHFHLEEGMFSLYPADSFPGHGKLSAILTACMNGAADTSREWRGVRVCVSNKKKRPESLQEAYGECAGVFGLAEKLGLKDMVVQFETVEFSYLFQHLPRESMATFCEEVLDALLSKDPDYSQEMLRTLEAFIENDGQINETAKQLFIHRNTAAYRLEKIGEILEVDFKNVNDLLRLKLVFVFRQMLKVV
ncbi:PucR family transcriptional regulator [Paenibacillus sp. H1-7]|uniref:PucR family transcriptional regulator n=1 Tax=Paenibacillus sp. H1-7 TaxID=2282849 RepID=UPI001EF9065D|nr:PucR family transcriptional regulator [Paenibacillus sp. H1-7]ULL14586.1 PucR family transcriptional regulator [Paenibacillus sp. H1-7]